MMDDIREQAAKIKAELAAQREGGANCGIAQRPIAIPKGRSGRFSDAHKTEFNKMESIEGHASAWRAQNGRFTPIKSLKRTNSKANLDGTPNSQRSGLVSSPGKATAEQAASSRPQAGLKRKSSAANLDGDRQISQKRANDSAMTGKPAGWTARDNQSQTAKRLKHRVQDDASSSRPKSLDTSPSKDSVFSRLTSPTKASKAHSAVSSKPTVSLVTSPSKSNLNGPPKSPSAASLTASSSKISDFKRRIMTPTSLRRVKSILRGNKEGLDESKSAIPHPTVPISLTPGPPRVHKELPPVPLTTPRRKLAKRVTFTPELVSKAASQNSPSPKRLGGFKLRSALKPISIRYPVLDEAASENTHADSLYPDLSPLKELMGTDRPEASPAPGTFTFRSDHTIKFGDSTASGFGASRGQSSVRQVRLSTVPSNMPGSFPVPPSPSSHPNKENAAPSPVRLLSGTVHGMKNKKRHRASAEEDDFEDGRAAKKLKSEKVPEGQELLAPRLVKAATPKTAQGAGYMPRRTPTSRTPSRTPLRAPGSASPIKRSGGISMSRLNMLAKPKSRA